MQYKHFSIEEREIIQRMWWERKSVRSIAQKLGRSPSSVSREMRRNFPPLHKVYTPRIANERALRKRKCRGRTLRLKSPRIRVYVTEHLKRRWSPEQISHALYRDTGERISHEAIYQFIYEPIHYDKPRVGYEDLRHCLRRRRKMRQRKGARRGQRLWRPKGISIDMRPAVVDRRSRIGDWEGDSVESCDHKPGINTLVERKTGYVCITKLRDKTSGATREAVTDRLAVLPVKAKHTLTLDNGPENQEWQELEAATGIDCFFAHPYRSSERGTNENTNGLIRDYFPKKTDFDAVTDDELHYVEYELNARPRKRLGWRTPLEAMSVALQG